MCVSFKPVREKLMCVTYPVVLNLRKRNWIENLKAVIFFTGLISCCTLWRVTAANWISRLT